MREEWFVHSPGPDSVKRSITRIIASIHMVKTPMLQLKKDGFRISLMGYGTLEK